ncbi:MAG: hypothetical protein KDM81_21040, partial [Verrucomicrobiae bacterium]|nr:hypothetical protein [Verrucomicrobiae bacterium]
FTEPVAATSALDPTHYQLSPTRSVRAVALGADPRLVELTVDPVVLGDAYTLTVRDVEDRAQSPNTIPAGSQVVFTPVAYAPAAVGEPPVAGTVTDVDAGANVEGSGIIGARADTFQFAYQLVTGDFDRRVRVARFTPTDPFASAGWMARATLEPNSAFAAVLVTPAQMGAFFLSRAQTGQEAVRSGSHPPNFPEMWLRLARHGSTFQGYASWDGERWTELGRTTLSLPGTVYLGFAVGSNDDASAALVQFRDVGDASAGTPLSQAPRPIETLGPSSRHTALAISEIHYHPRDRADGRRTEFLEIYNGDLIDQDLTGHRLSGAVSYAFPDGYVLPA